VSVTGNVIPGRLKEVRAVADDNNAPTRRTSASGPPVSDLVAAMQAAVDSVDSRPRGSENKGTGNKGSGNKPRTDRDGVKVHVLDEHDLPAVTRRSADTSFARALSATFGPVAAWTWLVLREAFLFIALFWTVALLMAAVAPALATLAGVITGTVVLRLGVFVATRAHLRNRDT